MEGVQIGRDEWRITPLLSGKKLKGGAMESTGQKWSSE
jgi:hypothetical protein